MGSVNLVTLQNLESYLPENYLYDYLWKKKKCKVLSIYGKKVQGSV